KGVQGANGTKMRQLQFMGIVCTAILFVVYRTTTYQHQQTKMEGSLHPFDTVEETYEASEELKYLPHGIVQARSDLELRPLWLTSSLTLKVERQSHRNLLAISAGIKQKENVDTIVQKFFSENFTVILFHYDCNVDGWQDLDWSNKAIHIVAHNQTKWWFAKRFLHPDVVSIYDYIFIWDEDLGVENFHPGRYLKIMKSEGLEISQPALDPDLSEVHHRITIRKRKKKVHRRIYETRGSVKCSDASKGPPCTGWVEGMAPVFSRSAWRCTWNLIQNDLVHGWGLDMKLGYCAQGDRTMKVGVIDAEFIVHQGVQTLGGSNARHVYKDDSHEESMQVQRRSAAAVDVRSERMRMHVGYFLSVWFYLQSLILQIRRQSTSELQIFKQRWEKAAKEDKNWVDPYRQTRTQTRYF
ncbi:hypothetical protein IFM89_014096, partial [Coptis chinensis]